MVGLGTLDDRMSGKQENWATFLALVVAAIICAAMILFGIFVWDKALLHRSHTRARFTTGEVVARGQIVPVSNNGFSVYQQDTLRYKGWNGSFVATVADLSVTSHSVVSICVRHTGQTFISASYQNTEENAPSNPCKPGQSGPIAGSVVIGLVLGICALVFSYWTIGNAMLVLPDAGARTASAYHEAWLGRRLRAAHIKRSVKWRTSKFYRLLHGRRPQHALTRAETLLAELEGMRSTPEVVAQREKTRLLITQLQSSKRQKADRVAEIGAQLDEMVDQLDHERQASATARAEANRELSQQDL
jgi:hypothetical protein